MAVPYGANAGAALGTAIMPGVGTAIGGLFGSFLDGGSGGGSPAAPLTASAAVFGSGLDGSGWAVNFGGTQTASSSPQNTAGNLPGAGAPLFAGMSTGNIPGWFWLAAGGLVLWKISRSKR